MPLKLKQPPADDPLPLARAVRKQIDATRDIARRYLDGLVNAERAPGVPFEVQRRDLARGQDDIIAAERLLKESEPQ